MQTHTRYDYDNASGKTIAYNYDVQGNRRSVTDPDQITSSYTYDARNRLEVATTEAGPTQYGWWEDNLPRRTAYPNGIVHDTDRDGAYDRADRVTRICNGTEAAVASECDSADPPSSLFSRYVYTYGPNRNRESQREFQRDLGLEEKTGYTYDRLNRLRQVRYRDQTSAIATVTYSLEPNSNRAAEAGTHPTTGQPLDREYEYDAVNALRQIIDNADLSRSVAFEYDGDLNQVARIENGVRTDFVYGIRDEMVAADARGGTQSCASTTTTSDWPGKEARRRDLTRRYFYDDSAVLVEYGSSSGFPSLEKYDYGRDLLGITSIAATSQARSTAFYLKDSLGSTANMTRASGLLCKSYRYDAWGALRAQSGSCLNARQYTGHYRDDETGLHYFGARYYDDDTARFLAQDEHFGEISRPPSLHRYLYAQGNPLLFIDPDGRRSEGQLDFMQSGMSRQEWERENRATARAYGQWWVGVKNLVVKTVEGMESAAEFAETVTPQFMFGAMFNSAVRDVTGVTLTDQYDQGIRRQMETSAALNKAVRSPLKTWSAAATALPDAFVAAVEAGDVDRAMQVGGEFTTGTLVTLQDASKFVGTGAATVKNTLEIMSYRRAGNQGVHLTNATVLAYDAAKQQKGAHISGGFDSNKSSGNVLKNLEKKAPGEGRIGEFDSVKKSMLKDVDYARKDSMTPKVDRAAAAELNSPMSEPWLDTSKGNGVCTNGFPRKQIPKAMRQAAMRPENRGLIDAASGEFNAQHYNQRGGLMSPEEWEATLTPEGLAWHHSQGKLLDVQSVRDLAKKPYMAVVKDGGFVYVKVPAPGIELSGNGVTGTFLPPGPQTVEEKRN